MRDESVSWMTNARQAAMAPIGPRRGVELDWGTALRLLDTVVLGRIVFTSHALPAIRPVNHVLDDGDIIIRTHDGAAIATQLRHPAAKGVVVSYEADAIDPRGHLGWSVVVTGYASLVTDSRDLARYREMLHPWVVDQPMDYAVRIHPEQVTGVWLTEPQ